MQANSIWVALGLTALVAVYFLIVIIQTIRKKRPATGPIGIILLSIGLLFAIFLLFRADELGAANLAQMILMIGLIMVTAAYASFAEKQAAASVKMAKEMKEQRITTSRPIIIQKSVYEKDIWEGSNKDYFSHFEISNVGNTPAIEVESSIVDNEGNSPHNIRQTYLSKDDPPIKFRPYGIANLEENKTYYLICDYKSIFSYDTQKPLYQTRLPFKISKAAEEGKIYVIPGELETKEVTDKDRIDAFGSKPK